MADLYTLKPPCTPEVAVLLDGTTKIMTAMISAGLHRGARIAALLACSLAAVMLAAGCSTGHPAAIKAGELAEAQTFPYYRVYWVGPSFDGNKLVSADGLRGYIEKIGTSVYYGDCVKTKFGSGTCELPLQVTTVIYRLHSNAPLGPQHNVLIRGVPAAVYDDGHSIEIYTGRVAIDVFSDRYAHALKAAEELLPVNAPGSSTGALPPPVYCPGLSGQQSAAVAAVMNHLPHHACKQTAAQQAFVKRLYG
jgi:hypothetical protein